MSAWASLCFVWTIRVLLVCSLFSVARIMLGPRGSDRLTALALLTSLVLASLVLFGVMEGRSPYLDVALIYDIFGFLGLLGIASFIREKKED
ncbi:MAG: pH regulation protein F [Spirochaetaceae bacterium]|nr:pH regulation protein F [Spirochaetaceae bacterium]